MRTMNDIDLSPLLESGADAGSIEVFGVRVGESASLLRDAPLTGVKPKIHPQNTTYHLGGRVTREDADGVEREVPLLRLFDEVLENGGLLLAGVVRFVVDGGVVRQIIVEGPALDVLRITCEVEIASRFGAPAGHERKFGRRTAYYPARDFSVAWSAAKNGLDHVTLGGVSGWTEPRLGARELLSLLSESWSGFEAHAFAVPPESTPPIYHRYLRAKALCTALGLGSVADAANGDFIARGDPSRYEHVVERLRLASGWNKRTIARRAHYDSFDETYQWLFNFRRQAHALLEYNSGIHVCGAATKLGAISIIEQAATPLRTSLEPIDAALLGFLDPEGRSFPLRALVEHHGYSDVDLNDLDADWY
jgi:hypothetical protein